MWRRDRVDSRRGSEGRRGGWAGAPRLDVLRSAAALETAGSSSPRYIRVLHYKTISFSVNRIKTQTALTSLLAPLPLKSPSSVGLPIVRKMGWSRHCFAGMPFMKKPLISSIVLPVTSPTQK